jgi:hypothetical protein
MIQLGFSDMLFSTNDWDSRNYDPDIVFLKKQIQGLSIEQQTTVPHTGHIVIWFAVLRIFPFLK